MMIWNMESKLNKSWFSRYNRKTDTYAKLSINQYWDWLIYIDVRDCTTLNYLSNHYCVIYRMII